MARTSFILSDSRQPTSSVLKLARFKRPFKKLETNFDVKITLTSSENFQLFAQDVQKLITQKQW